MGKNLQAVGAAILLVSATGSMHLFAQENAAPSTTGVPADNTKINERDKSDQTLKSTNQPNNSDDVKLAAAVREAIVKDKSLSTTAHNVKLVAANGVVTLRGPVASETEKEKVGQCASSVAGVSKVDNQLDVKTKSP